MTNESRVCVSKLWIEPIWWLWRGAVHGMVHDILFSSNALVVQCTALVLLHLLTYCMQTLISSVHTTYMFIPHVGLQYIICLLYSNSYSVTNLSTCAFGVFTAIHKNPFLASSRVTVLHCFWITFAGMYCTSNVATSQNEKQMACNEKQEHS